MIDHFHAAVLLDPKLADDDVVDTTGGVCPGVCFIKSAETNEQEAKMKITTEDAATKGIKTHQTACALTWGAPVWWFLWALLLCSFPKTSVWGRWNHGRRNPPQGPRHERHWLEGDGLPALTPTGSPSHLWWRTEVRSALKLVYYWSHTHLYICCWAQCLTWSAHTFRPAVGWKASQSSPTVTLQLTRQMLQHTNDRNFFNY